MAEFDFFKVIEWYFLFLEKGLTFAKRRRLSYHALKSGRPFWLQAAPSSKTQKVFFILKKGTNPSSVLDLTGGLTPSGASQPPPGLYWPPEKIVKICQKYISDPPLVFPQIEYVYVHVALCTSNPKNYVLTIYILLVEYPYVHVIALDFSKAFDTVSLIYRHSTLLAKCADCLLRMLCTTGSWVFLTIEPIVPNLLAA